MCFFRNILDEVVEKLKALGAERKRVGKLWYWGIEEGV
jgi:hypothetical protein